MNIGERITQLRDRFSNGNNLKFAELMDASPTTTSNWCKAESLGKDVIMKILTRFPEVDANWLLMGTGEMMKQSPNQSYCSQTTDINKGIPLIPLSAMAGPFAGEETVLECECERYIVPAFAGADFLIHVKGDSMQPAFNAGDIVACKKLPLGGLFFQWNKVYVLNTDQGALIKRIHKGSDQEHILIVSDNEKYEPFELPIESVYGVALVIGTIRLE